MTSIKEGTRSDAKSVPLRAVSKGNPNDEIITEYFGTSVVNDYKDHAGNINFDISIPLR